MFLNIVIDFLSFLLLINLAKLQKEKDLSGHKHKKVSAFKSSHSDFSTKNLEQKVQPKLNEIHQGKEVPFSYFEISTKDKLYIEARNKKAEPPTVIQREKLHVKYSWFDLKDIDNGLLDLGNLTESNPQVNFLSFQEVLFFRIQF
jgi:hypothetical protein